MTLATPDAPKKAKAGARSAVKPRARPKQLPQSVQRQLARFDVSCRANARALVRSSTAVAELADVFPGLLYALATTHGSAEAQEQALSLINQGARLKSVARALDVPMWLRRLPPEAFAGDIGALPHGDAFTRRIATRIPARISDAAAWLQAVRFAAHAADEDFALWIARQRSACHAPPAERRLAVLAAYAWFSRAGEGEVSRLVWSRWRPEMALETAVCAAKSWFNRVLLATYLSPATKIDCWLDPGEAGDFRFVPLIDAQSLFEESRLMNNCADQYGAAIVSNRSRLFSVRSGERRIATIEIQAHPREKTALSITQLKSVCNMPAGLEIWQAAYRWLGSQSRLIEAGPARAHAEPVVTQEVWTRLFHGYRAAHRGACWLPATPSLDDIASLEAGLASLARDCCVRSWLFN